MSPGYLRSPCLVHWYRVAGRYLEVEAMGATDCGNGPEAGESSPVQFFSKVVKGDRPTMRKLVVCNIVSLDGFFSGPGGDVMVMPFDNGFSDYNAERLRAADTLLLGRKSYEGFRSYWPAIAEDESQPAVEREISRLIGPVCHRALTASLQPAFPWLCRGRLIFSP